jgi:hypothetical protein
MRRFRALGTIGVACSYAAHATWATAAASLEEPDEFAPQIAVYGELGGSAIVTSVNVELRPLEMLSLRAGGVVLPVPFLGFAPISVAGANLLAGNERHHAEVGLNYVHVWIHDNDARFLNPTLGYRYQPNTTGFLFRATLTPLIRTNDFSDVLPWLGLSFGWCGSL